MVLTHLLALTPWPPTSSPAKTTAAGEHEEQINEATTYLKTVRTRTRCAHGHTPRARPHAW
jgi:hypothetical protein